MDLVEIAIHPSCSVRPLKDKRKGDCCGIKFEATTNGYYCEKCDLFFHKGCINPLNTIKNHPSHKCDSILVVNYQTSQKRCLICKERTILGSATYLCWKHRGTIVLHVDCAKYPPPKVIHSPRDHEHKLKLEKVESFFTCAACGKRGDGYSYKCHECHLTFHVKCQKFAPEINHISHSLHPLKLCYGDLPSYTDGKCRLCGKIPVDEAFYHCSFCNFTLDLHCAFNPLPLYHDDVNIHDHKLTLMPKAISFTCTTCGLNGDRSPYVCLQCDFTAHNDCSGYPWVININRHDHRVSRTSLLGVVNSVCGVCQKKLDWSMKEVEKMYGTG